jgi:hypothetical protein
MRRSARCTGLLMLMLLMGIGQESRTPRVAITGKMVEVSAPIQVTTESDLHLSAGWSKPRFYREACRDSARYPRLW